MSYWDTDKETILGLRPEDFAVTRLFETRWRDNDSQGHMNNAVYYEYFDSALNTWLHEGVNGEVEAGSVLQFVVESGCKYLSEVAYPTPILIGLKVTKLGRSSMVLEMGMFPVRNGEAGEIAALGHWAQVFVDPQTRRPTEIPGRIRAVLESAT